MPFIDCRITKKLTDDEKEKLKKELGRAISVMNKPEQYLMVGIADGYTLYFGGKKLSDGAFVDVRVLGGVRSDSSEKMSGEICAVLKDLSGIQPNNVYITYQGYSDWGWNGGNF